MDQLPAFVPLALLGAALGLDVVSFAQAMVSRPLVAATLAGWVSGDAAAGFLVAAILELIAVETLPVGASRYPEWGSAAVVGGALAGAAPAAGSGGPHAGAICLAVLAALVTAWVSGGSMVLVRKLNGRLARRNLDRVAAGDGGTVHRLQLTGLGVDFLRGLVITTVGLIVFTPALEVAIRTWSADMMLSRAVVVGAGAMVAAGAVWKLFHAVPRARWLFVGGLAVGLAALNFI
jgi:mannose/fructose/N-acetylgalactosamine-specific phosphotransferase system component IIC